MRIITGTLKGRRLAAPPGQSVRPTSDRLRETLFNVLGDSIVGTRILDAFAGTGAIGIEALSRGAVHATFVESDARVIRVLSSNIRTCGVAEACVIIRHDFLSARPSGAPVDLVIADPPYDIAALEDVVAGGAGWLAGRGRLVLEHSRRRPSPEAAGALRRTRILTAGDSALSFYSHHKTTPGVVSGDDGETTPGVCTVTESTMANPRIAIFPGSFDPPTLGHLDIIRRAASMFDVLIVALLENPSKHPAFSAADRVTMLRKAIGPLDHVTVESFQGLLAEYARARQASVIVRGVRGGADLEYERQMADTNRHLNSSIDTVFLTPSPAVAHISSTLVRDIASHGGSVHGLVPDAVEAAVAERMFSGRSPRTQQV